LTESGKLLGLTFDKGEVVIAWHKHDIGGKIESICVIPGNKSSDAVCFLIAMFVLLRALSLDDFITNSSLIVPTTKFSAGVIAWHKHDIGGKIESICVIPGNKSSDILFLNVTRNGKSSIEVLRKGKALGRVNDNTIETCKFT
jgi:hypothetical protein